MARIRATFGYGGTARTLHVGEGEYARSPRIFVSGLKVVQSWLRYRMRNGVGRASSPLDGIRPGRWTSRFTTELLELLWVLEATVEGWPEQERLLEAVLGSGCLRAGELPPVPEEMRKAPREGRRPLARPGRLIGLRESAWVQGMPGGDGKKWTPMIGQVDQCPPPPLVPPLHAALGHELLPAYTSSGVRRTTGPDGDARHCRTGKERPSPARAAATPSQACRYTSSYFTLRHSRSTNTLSTHRPLPSLPMATSAPLSTSVNAAPVNCVPWSVSNISRLPKCASASSNASTQKSPWRALDSRTRLRLAFIPRSPSQSLNRRLP